jgi:hypothetical protein
VRPGARRRRIALVLGRGAVAGARPARTRTEAPLSCTDVPNFLKIFVDGRP